MAQSADALLKAGMKTNKPRRIKKGEPGYGKKKFVVVASSGGKKKVIRFGDAKMAIRQIQLQILSRTRARIRLTSLTHVSHQKIVVH